MKKLTVQILVLLLILSLSLQTIPTFARAEAKLLPIAPQITGQKSVETLFLQEEEHFNLVPDRPEPYQRLLQYADLPQEMREHLQRESVIPGQLNYIAPSVKQLAQTQEQVQSFTCTDTMDVPKAECEALVALYSSTNGAGWTNNSGWLSGTTVDPWYGVTVTSGDVTNLYLPSNELTGSIPPLLGSLSNLVYLYLYSNQLSGSIPPELGNLTKLQFLALQLNKLDGSIPSALGSLTNLYYLNLSNNQFSGSIPINFIKLAALGYLYFEETSLCEPNTPEFLAWKDTVYTWRGAGLVCKYLFLPMINK